jgi:hypothetical protein
MGAGDVAEVGVSGNGQYTMSLFKSSIDDFGDLML